MNSSVAVDFPTYSDGDVSIIVSPQHTYKLHSSVLKRNSSFFLGAINEAPGTRLTSKARQEGAAAYRFELTTSGPQDIGSFERKVVSETGKIVQSMLTDPNLNNIRIADAKARFWDWLFGSFYGRQPAFDDHNLATVLSDCMGLVDVAENIDSVDYIREIVDLALLRQDDILWQSIRGNPTAWAELGRRVHSPTIFREGVCHLVGRWNTMSEEDKNEMNEDIRRVCDKKVKDLNVAKEAIEMRILGHYPAFLCRSASDRPGRPSYANDIYMWMAICFFRQWFAQAISDGRTHMAEDGGYNFYNALARGGQAYLHHEDFRNFHQYFPMSSKACNVLEANMGVLKEDVKQFVADLVKVRIHLKPEENDINWLTCALVDKEDFPWYVPEEIPNDDSDLFGDTQMDDDAQTQAEAEATPVPETPGVLPMRHPHGKKRMGGTLGGLQMQAAGTPGDDSGFMADIEE